MLFNVKFYKTISLNVALGPNEIINVKIPILLLFLLIICAPSRNSSLFFDLSFLKIILEVLFIAFYSAKYTCYFL